MEQLILSARWPGLVILCLGGLLLSWRLLAPELEPKQLLRWGRGRVEQALVPVVGTHAAPEIASAALLAGGIALLVTGVPLVLAMGAAGLLLAPFAGLSVGWMVASKGASKRQERLAEQVQGLAQALAAGLAGENASGGAALGLLRRYYRQVEAPLREDLEFMELVLRGQADLGEALANASQSTANRQLQALLELLHVIYQESLDMPAQRQALRVFLARVQQDDQVRRTVRVESRFGQTSQAIILYLIPGFAVLAAVAGSVLGSQVSVLDFYLRTLPGQVIAIVAVLVEVLVAVVSRGMVRKIQWE